MRKIKFRVWDDIHKKMYRCEEPDSQNAFKIYLAGNASFNGEFCGNEWCFMQYTGLKDKNGKEIYEGDILWAKGKKEFKEDSKISDVIFNLKDLSWEVRNKGFQHGLPLNWGGWKSLKVIGNIYENPELLTAKK